jgi:hypothetical protein
MKTLKAGDVVIIEWKDNGVYSLEMKPYDIGIVMRKSKSGLYAVYVCMKEYEYYYYFKSSLTKIGTL